jgi:hypothetical protein
MGLQAEEDPAYKQLMKNVGATFGSLGKNVQAKNGEAAAEDAKKLAGLFKEVEAFWTKSNTADAIALRSSSPEGIFGGCGKCKGEQLRAGFSRSGQHCQSCKGCHDAHKPKR